MGNPEIDDAPFVAESGAKGETVQTNSLPLSTQIIRATAWNVVGAMAKQGVALGATVIVARLLSPTDYAIGGLAVTIMVLFTVVTGQGFAQALVQRKELSDLTCDSVFWPMVIGGMCLMGLAMLAAPWLARFYGQPDLMPVIRLLSIGLAIGMVGAVPNALLQRAMCFREINLIGIVGGTVSAGLGIGLAMLGHGYWALVTPIAGSTICTAIGAFRLSKYHPRRQFSLADFRSTVAFGLSLLGSNLIQYFNDYGDRLILGRFWKPDDLGFYYFALERSRQPFTLIMTQISTVIFPAFSTIQHDRRRLKGAVLIGTLRFCMVVFPLYVFLVGLADPLMPWLFGSQWRPATIVFQVFAVYSFARAFAALVPGTLLAIGQPQVNLIFNIFRAILILPALLYLGIRQADIVATSIALVTIWLIQFPFYVGYLFHQVGIGLGDIWNSFRGLLLATFLMSIVLVLTRTVGELMGWSQWAAVVCSIAVPSGLFLLVLRRELAEMLQQVRRAYGVGSHQTRQETR